jgi:hypothetical protein
MWSGLHVFAQRFLRPIIVYSKEMNGEEAAQLFISGILDPIPVLDEIDPILGMDEHILEQVDAAFTSHHFQLAHLPRIFNELANILMDEGFERDNLVLYDWISTALDEWIEDMQDHENSSYENPSGRPWPISALAGFLKPMTRDKNKHFVRRILETLWMKHIDGNFYTFFQGILDLLKAWELDQERLVWACENFLESDDTVDESHRETMIAYAKGLHVHIHDVPDPYGEGNEHFHDHMFDFPGMGTHQHWHDDVDDEGWSDEEDEEDWDEGYSEEVGSNDYDDLPPLHQEEEYDHLPALEPMDVEDQEGWETDPSAD